MSKRKLMNGRTVELLEDATRPSCTLCQDVATGEIITLPDAVINLLPDAPGRPTLPPGQKLERRHLSMPPEYWTAVDKQPDKARIVLQRACARYLTLDTALIR